MKPTPPNPSSRPQQSPISDTAVRAENTPIVKPSESFTLAQTEHIAKVQEQKEAEVEQKYREDAERAEAAGKIQRVFRGHRARRGMDGLSLDPATRWNELIRDARYRQVTTPRARTFTVGDEDEPEQKARERKSSEARARWHTAGQIARHAHGQEPSNEEDESSSEDDKLSKISSSARSFLRRQEKSEKDGWRGKMMDLPYFLEMVDLKHRYGSNLRTYHEEWKKSDSRENFFYWLDHGEGRQVEVTAVPRERLEREQVRYLSREERQQYLVKFDKDGRLRWAKNGNLLDTTEEYRDSVDGIVPQASPSKTYRQDELEALQRKGAAEDRANADSSDSTYSDAETRYPDPPKFADAKGPKKVINVTPAVIFNRLMRKSVKKNTWIFVVDRSMNMYVGIKQSGSFQHSSFIQGSRITAAGLIKIKNGQIHSLSPLSGHYRPPTAAFKAFLAHLKSHNVDMSHVSISKSYAVLVGLEAYKTTQQKIKGVGQGIKHEAGKVKHGGNGEERPIAISDRTKP